MSNYQTRYHRDGTVTVWDVYQQQWTRREASAVYADDRVMASMPERDRLRIEAMAAGDTMREHMAAARAILRAADDGGTIQASDMIDLVGRAHPEQHTTCSIYTAADYCGCRLALNSLIEY